MNTVLICSFTFFLLIACCAISFFCGVMCGKQRKILPKVYSVAKSGKKKKSKEEIEVDKKRNEQNKQFADGFFNMMSFNGINEKKK